MVCPKLKKGKCKATRKHCSKKYMTKMKRWKMCSVHKKAKKKVPKKRKVVRKKKKR
ncbi:MAG: hypothetical protein ABIG30_03545 [Candidatus Aenigmatarchaeota archaeon]